MGFFIDSIRALGTTLRNMLRPATTIEFPDVIRPRPERHRVSFALLIDETGDEACIGCLACERICPSRVIFVKQAPKRESKVTGKKRGYAEDFTIDLEACIFCELCVQVCPTDAIVMCRTAEEPGFCREDLVLTQDKLYANQKLKQLAWGTGAKLMEMQDPARGKPGAKTKEGEGEGEKATDAGAEKPKKAVKAKGVKTGAETAKETAKESVKEVTQTPPVAKEAAVSAKDTAQESVPRSEVLKQSPNSADGLASQGDTKKETKESP